MSFYTIFFSPTGGTKKAAEIFADAWDKTGIAVDLIKYPPSASELNLNADDICLIAVPSFGGRVPKPAVDRLKEIKGNGATAILAAVFGNRAIDDTLMELYDTLTEAGFVCRAAFEAVAEHSLMRQFAAGRPDEKDREDLEQFVSQIKEAFKGPGSDLEPQLPGSHSYREFGGVPLKPTVSKQCIRCGLCAKECPAGAIPENEPDTTQKETCISCMHCVSVCPKQARSLNKMMVLVASQKLKKACRDRKENKLYLFIPS